MQDSKKTETKADEDYHDYAR